MKIAILMTSNDTSDFSNNFPDDGEMVRMLLEPRRPDWEFTNLNVTQNIFPTSTDAYDGYIITGSPASVHDPYDWVVELKSLIQKIASQKIPLIGLCFGHQAIATALGGQVDKNPGGWVLGTEETSFCDTLPHMTPPQDRVRLYAAHCEQVTRLPVDTEIIGTNPSCPIAGFMVGNHIFTTQYHPEMLPDFMKGLPDVMKGYAPDPVLDSARIQLETAAEGDFFAQWMVQFLEMDRTIA